MPSPMLRASVVVPSVLILAVLALPLPAFADYTASGMRDSSGNIVDSVGISLPRLGHVAKFFSERDWFGRA